MQVYDMNKIKRGVERARDAYNGTLRQLFPDSEFVVDEMAVLFDQREAMETWLELAQEAGWLRLFPDPKNNHGSDWVDIEPFAVRARVEYAWRDAGDYRIEAVRTLTGFNPVFEAARYGVAPNVAPHAQLGLVMHIHASFKVDLGVYMFVCEALQRKGWVMGQRCTSDYGQFAYFKPGTIDERDERGLPEMWLKPRVNLRDLPAVPARGL